MKATAATIGILVALLALGWLFTGNDFFLFKVFAPKYEQVRRETFEQSKAYRQGAIQELQNMQFQYEHEMSTIRLRFLVDDPDALFTEYLQRGLECSASGIRDTPWATREFALYDMDRNSLTFYRDLKSAENEHTTA